MDALGIVEKIVNVALMIKEAVRTVQQNKRECGDIERCVAQVSAILLRTKENREVFQHPSVSGPLEDLATSVQEALTLVTDCQHRQGARRLWEATEMAEKLRRVQEGIRGKLQMCNFATSVDNNIKLNNRQQASAHSPQMTLENVATNASNSGRSTNIQQADAPPPPPPVVYSIRQFSLSELNAATNNFSDGNIIERGAYGIIYKGEFDGLVVAIKKHELMDHYIEREDDIQKKINIVSELNHENIVRPLGYCQVRLHGENVGTPELAFYFIEEYMANRSMEKIIKGPPIGWPSCFRIIQGIAKGLHYLHEHHVVHLSLKPSSILLDSHMNPKIGDSLLYTRLVHGDDEITSATMTGSLDYVAPEYIKQSIVSTKCDVYAFGVTLLETSSSMCRSKPRFVQDLAGWAWEKAWKAGRMEDLFGSSSCDESQLREIKRCLVVGLLCVQHDRKDRPTMADVLAMLNGEKEVPAPKKPA